jgi:hypothetical protein
VLEFSAHKLVVSTSLRVEAQTKTAATASTELVASPEGVVQEVSPDGALWLATSLSVLGRKFENELWMNPADGNALQLIVTETGSKNHRRLSRFCVDGVFAETRVPLNSTEAVAAPESWSQVTTQFIAFPPEKKGPVLAPTALLWLLTDPELGKPGDRRVAQVWAKAQLENTTAEVTGTAVVPGISVIGPSGTTPSGNIDALEVAISAVPVDPTATSNLELMGFQGDLKLSLDPSTRAPVGVEGTVPMFGKLVMHLVSVEVSGGGKP